jgi:hypothetical protein
MTTTMMNNDDKKIDQLARAILELVRKFVRDAPPSIDRSDLIPDALNAVALVAASLLSDEPDRVETRKYFDDIVTKQLLIFDRNKEAKQKPKQ